MKSNYITYGTQSFVYLVDDEVCQQDLKGHRPKFKIWGGGLKETHTKYLTEKRKKKATKDIWTWDLFYRIIKLYFIDHVLLYNADLSKFFQWYYRSTEIVTWMESRILRKAFPISVLASDSADMMTSLDLIQYWRNHYVDLSPWTWVWYLGINE